jgi:hypothetical protein
MTFINRRRGYNIEYWALISLNNKISVDICSINLKVGQRQVETDQVEYPTLSTAFQVIFCIKNKSLAFFRFFLK